MMRSKRFPIAALAVLFVSTLFVGVVPGQVRGAGRRGQETRQPEKPQARLLLENFAYSAGQLTTVSGGNWVSLSGSTNLIQVTSGSLVYPNYPASGVGNKIDIVAASVTTGEDVSRQFATQASGTVYAAFLVNFTNTTGLAAATSSTGDYFAGFMSSSTGSMNCRVSIKAGVTADTVVVGLRPSSSDASATFYPTELPINTTHLLVFSNEIVANAANDICRMWVNPVTGPAEPLSGANVMATSATDLADVGRLFIRQSSDTPNASIDGIQVGTSWADVANTVLTASGVSLSGRVSTRSGRGITNAAVMISGETLPEPRAKYTGRNGAYFFDGLEAGRTYVITVGSQRYTFTNSSRVIAVSDDVTNADFASDQ